MSLFMVFVVIFVFILTHNLNFFDVLLVKLIIKDFYSLIETIFFNNFSAIR